MKKGKLIGKIFGIALVFVMIGAMLGGLPVSPAMAGASEHLDASAPPEGYIPTPTVEKFGQADALLIQDKDVWGRNSNELALIEAGISYDLRHSCNLLTIDLSEYKFIIYSSDQTQEYYENIEANIDKIESFVSNGGLLIAHVCDQAWTPANWSGMHILPGNVEHATGIYLQDLTIADTEHPIVRGTPTGNFDIHATNPDYFDGWGWSTHGYLTNLFPSTDTVVAIETGAYPGQPTYIEYSFGSGKVLATMQTVEWGYFSGSQGWCGNRPELLRNELRFAVKLCGMHAEELHMTPTIWSSFRGFPFLLAIYANVRIVTEDNYPLEGAEIRGHWEGPEGPIPEKDCEVSETTNDQGEASLRAFVLAAEAYENTYTFMLDSVVKTGYVYIPQNNGDFDGDGEPGDISNSVYIPHLDPIGKTLEWLGKQTVKGLNWVVQLLPHDAFRHSADTTEQKKNALYEKLVENAEGDAVTQLVEAGQYQQAIDKLNHDIRSKCDGSLGGNPQNDWIIDPQAQQELCTMIDALTDCLETLL